LAGAARRFRYRADNHARFPDVYATSGKWFRRTGELLRRVNPTKQSPEKFNGFSQMPWWNLPCGEPVVAGGGFKRGGFLTFFWWRSG
jgi:hypothetical protein